MNHCRATFNASTVYKIYVYTYTAHSSIYIKQCVGLCVRPSVTTPIGHPLGMFLRSTARIRGPSGPEILVHTYLLCCY